MDTPALKIDIQGATSYWLKTDKVELHLTEEGGHLAPVHFKLKHRWVSPYSLPPWHPQELPPGTPTVLRILRGDFFCFPFGETKSIPHVHGDTANARWKLVKANVLNMVLEMELKSTPGTVRKIISLEPNQRAVYQEHIISGVQGRYNFGHHAIIQFPEKGGPFHISASPFKFGQVKPDPFTNPVIGEYSSLKTGAVFNNLAAVPLANGETTSLQEFPSREGFEDLVMISSKPAPFAWTAVTLDGYIWFSIKDPDQLPSTLFWFSHGGRHQEPWNGRHRYRVGIEEVRSHFCDGLTVSRRNLLKQRDIPTTGAFSAKSPTSIRMIQAVHQVPRNFGKVVSIEPSTKEHEVVITGEFGETVSAPINLDFLECNPQR